MGESKKYIIGNWKSNKTKEDVAVFFSLFSHLIKTDKYSASPVVEAVICPSFIHLEQSSEFIQKLQIPIFLGAQNISPFGAGSYTGEVSAYQLKEYVRYVIIGHFERRKHFGETDTLLTLKSKQASNAGLKSIYCVPDAVTAVPKDVAIIAYEPIFAIGTGSPDSPQNANNVIKEIKNKNPKVPVIYGGSVTKDNIKEFLKMDSIDGVLPGKASLDADHFYRMLLNAAD